MHMLCLRLAGDAAVVARLGGRERGQGALFPIPRRRCGGDGLRLRWIRGSSHGPATAIATAVTTTTALPTTSLAAALAAAAFVLSTTAFVLSTTAFGSASATEPASVALVPACNRAHRRAGRGLLPRHRRRQHLGELQPDLHGHGGGLRLVMRVGGGMHMLCLRLAGDAAVVARLGGLRERG